MKLLIITQKVDDKDAILGFFVAWLKEFAKNVDQVTVITLFKGDYQLPSNVEIYSLGKEKGKGRISRLLKFRKLIKQLLPESDAVLAHMCPEYVIALKHENIKAKKPLFLWYTHKSVSKYLIKAEKLVEKIFTASKESCRIESNKIVITGHGIDFEHFRPKEKSAKDYFEIATVGRIAPVKNLETLIEAVSQLPFEVKEKIKVKIIGEPLLEVDEKYENDLRSMIDEQGLHKVVKFTGPVVYNDLPKVLSQADLFVNLSKTGSIDKAVLEAMAMNIPVLTSNEAFKDLLPPENFCADNQLAKKIIGFYYRLPKADLRTIIENQHNLKSLINRIVDEVSELL